MRILTLHNKYKIRGGEDESSESEDSMLRSKGHAIFRYEQDNAVIGSTKLVQIAARTIYSGKSYHHIRELLRTLRPHLVDIHNFFPLISPSAYYACEAEGVPVVQTLHNYRLMCPGALVFREGKPCEDCLTKAFPYPGIQHRCYRNSAFGSATVAAMIGVHRLLNTWRDHVGMYITLTEFCRKKFIQAGLPAEKICVKPHFVYPDPGIGDGSGEFALFVGRLTPEKGPETLIRAWKLLQCQLTLKIIGEGPIGDSVAQQCRELACVECLGRRPVEEVYQLMGNAKILLFPSECYETFGRVAIEAFAKGTPVVLSDIGALSELVEHGRTGWYFPPGDAEALAAIVDHILTHQQILPAMRREARHEFETKYTAEINYLKSMEVFDEAISRSPHRNTAIPESIPSPAQAPSFIRVY
jgi:glycosyltransferase involved in cell wall biosynthesis